MWRGRPGLRRRTRCRPAPARRRRGSSRRRRRRVKMPPTPMIGRSAAGQPVERAHHGGGTIAQRRAAQPAGLARRARCAARQHAAVDGGVGGDQAGDAAAARRRRRRRAARRRSRSGATLTSSGRGAAPRRRASRWFSRLQGGEQRRELRLRLQIAQPGRVRRADVDDDVVGDSEQRAPGWRGSRRPRRRAASTRDLPRLMPSGIGGRRRASRAAQVARHRGGAVVVEAQPIDAAPARSAGGTGAASGCRAAPAR